MGIDPNNAAATAPMAPPVQAPAVPLPNVQPAAAPAAEPGFLQGLASMIGNWFMSGTSAKDLAGPQQPQTALSPLELQQQRDRFKQLAPPQ
jgi:hypothetical protein